MAKAKTFYVSGVFGGYGLRVRLANHPVLKTGPKYRPLQDLANMLNSALHPVRKRTLAEIAIRRAWPKVRPIRPDGTFPKQYKARRK